METTGRWLEFDEGVASWTDKGAAKRREVVFLFRLVESGRKSRKEERNERAQLRSEIAISLFYEWMDGWMVALHGDMPHKEKGLTKETVVRWGFAPDSWGLTFECLPNARI